MRESRINLSAPLAIPLMLDVRLPVAYRYLDRLESKENENSKLQSFRGERSYLLTAHCITAKHNGILCTITSDTQ